MENEYAQNVRILGMIIECRKQLKENEKQNKGAQVRN